MGNCLAVPPTARGEIPWFGQAATLLHGDATAAAAAALLGWTMGVGIFIFKRVL
jgi:hypothetical protein